MPHYQKLDSIKHNTENESEEEAPSNDEDAEDNNKPHDTSTHSNATCEGLKLKTGQVVTCTHSGRGQAHTGKILSQAGKATGTYKNWYNLQYTEPEEIAGTSGSVDLGQIDSLHLGPSEYAGLCADCHKEDVLIVNDDAFMPAKHAELSNWK